jgi:hypothetical protein
VKPAWKRDRIYLLASDDTRELLVFSFPPSPSSLSALSTFGTPVIWSRLVARFWEVGNSGVWSFWFVEGLGAWR